jgi:hypothetical protein
MTFLFRTVSAAVLGLALSGCFYDNPLTGGPTKGVNTWILGVWETTNDKGETARVKVAPTASDRYSVEFSAPSKKPGEGARYRFDMWPSQVGGTLFLTLACTESSGKIPTGAHVFVQAQLLDQNSIRTRGLKLDASPSASSYELRKEIRAKLRDLSLYEGAESAAWSRVEEVVWAKDGATLTFQPIRNPQIRSVPVDASRMKPEDDPELKKIRNPGL